MEFFHNLLRAIKLFFAQFKFHNSTEKILFAAFFIVFFAVQIFSYQYVTTDKILGYDLWLLSWIKEPATAAASLRHPLLQTFFIPFILLFKVLTLFINVKYAVFILCMFYMCVVSYCFVFIFRILFELLGISRLRAVLLTVLFSSFAHIMIQAFLIESFPLSLLLLILTLYISGLEIYKKETFTPYMYIVLFILTTGVTITNGVKIVVAFLFKKEAFAKKVKWMVIMGFCFFALVVPVILVTKYVISNPQKIVATGAPSVKKAQPAGGILGSHTPSALSFIDFKIHLFQSARQNFLEESTMFHTTDFQKDIDKGRDVYIQYSSPAYDWIVLSFYVITAILLILSLNQQYIKLLLAVLSVDVFIHLICRFGIGEPYIYAAHWMFIIPIIWGFLYKNQSLKKLYHVFDVVIVGFSGFFLYYNWHMIFDYLSPFINK